MDKFLDRIFGSKPASASAAKERLKMVLIHDRTDISPGLLDRMKNELMDVIIRYVEIDPSEVRIEMTQDGREQRLIADIPLLGQKRKQTKR
jgi:cell division topological specificity factor